MAGNKTPNVSRGLSGKKLPWTRRLGTLTVVHATGSLSQDSFQNHGRPQPTSTVILLLFRVPAMIQTRLRSGAAAAKRISTLTSDVPAVKTKKKSNQSDRTNGGEDKPRVKEDILEQATSSKKVSQRKARSVPVKIEYSDGALKEEHSAGASPYFTWKPDNWEQVLSNIRRMRQEREAPVDTMGCDKCPDQALPEKLVRYQLLVSLMLSSQTKDEVTHAAVGRLRDFGLTPEVVSAAEEKQLEELIYPVSFYKNKAKHLKRTSQVLLDEYDGDIPDSIEGLCKLPGVGPKMSYLAMSCGWKRTVGIGVDTHVHRISNWLGWLPQATKTPEQTRKALEAWLPRDLWDEVNHLLVGFGQTVCKPVAPKCSSCLNLQLCPYGRKQVNSKKEAT